MSEKDWMEITNPERLWILKPLRKDSVVRLAEINYQWHLDVEATSLATFPFLENTNPPFRQAEYILALKGLLPEHITLETGDDNE